MLIYLELRLLERLQWVEKRHRRRAARL